MTDNIDTNPWIEKYRPKTLDEILSHDAIISTLRTFINNKCLPHLLFYGLSGLGKCLAPNTPIIMYDGTIKLAKNIIAGDMLMGDDNTVRNVLSTTKGVDVMYKIIQNNGDDYIVNSEHIISLKLSSPFLHIWNKQNNKYILFWYENHELKKKTFSVKTTKHRAYYTLCKYKQYLIVNKIANKKGDVCDISIQDYINKSFIWKKQYNGFKCNAITCWKKQETEIDPYLFGYQFGHKIANIPYNYKINNVENRMLLLAGLLDSDRYSDKEICYEVIQASNTLFNDIVFVARSLGFVVSIENKTLVNDVYYNKATISGSNIWQVPTKNYNKRLNKTANNNSLTYNIQVEKLERNEYYGFEIDDNRRFLLGDFTVTHNTSMIIATAKELYGKHYPYMVMELNASDDRGIEVVRNKIKQFVKSKNVFISDTCEDSPQEKFKLVILDEADAMTNDAQAILRKIVEEYTNNTRFCLICNNIQNISPALKSRCTIFRFSPIGADKIKEKILDVSKKESLKITEDAINTIIKRSTGDMRKVINILQSVSMSYKIVNEENINTCLGYPRVNVILNIVESLLCKSFGDSYNKITELIINHGYALSDIINELHDILVESILNNKNPIKILDKIDKEVIINILDKLRTIEYNQSVNIIDNTQISGLIGIFKIYTKV